MNFDWAEYLNLADAIYGARVSLANEEACLRSAISRAYYSAFCAARNRARDMDGLTVTNTAADHGLVRNHFQTAADRQRQKIGTWLDRLRDNRNLADYADRMAHVNPVCNSSLSQARNVLDGLNHLS